LKRLGSEKVFNEHFAYLQMFQSFLPYHAQVRRMRRMMMKKSQKMINPKNIARFQAPKVSTHMPMMNLAC